MCSCLHEAPSDHRNANRLGDQQHLLPALTAPSSAFLLQVLGMTHGNRPYV